VIGEVRLRNFKCFEHQNLTLAPLTVLSGLNGMGKSTTLQALLALRQSHQQGLLSGTGLALNGELINLGTAQDVLCEVADEEQIGLGVFMPGGVGLEWNFKYDETEANVIPLVKEVDYGELTHLGLFGKRFHYLQAERVGPRPVLAISDYHVRRRMELGTQGEYVAHYLMVYGKEKVQATQLCHPDGASDALMDQAEAWLGEVCPGTRLHVAAHPGTDLVSLRYSFVLGKDTTRQYRATNVGFGLTYSLPVLVSLLSATGDMLILLENPEAHIHPAGQVVLGRLMAKSVCAGAQVVVETHSDHVLNGIRLALRASVIPPESVQVHFFRRGGPDANYGLLVDSPRIGPDGRIDSWPDGFFDEWDKSLEALLEE